MKRIVAIIAALLVPAVAFALDFTDVSSRYTDAPFSTSDAAGISVLTNLGAISGNPDGSFAPTRPVNRAEFLKIFFGSSPSMVAANSDAADCFPDVSATAWYSKYVCLAKKNNIVLGYPDGLFHPERNVNYAEALAILGRAYGVTGVSSKSNPPWYEIYQLGAYNEGIGLLGLQTQMDHVLTRAEIARLAAAYRAWHDGVLVQYHAFERGESMSSSSASSTSSSRVSTASVSSGSGSSAQNSTLSSSTASSSVSSVSSSSVTLFPATSHFLLTGRTSPVVADGMFTSQSEDVAIRFVDFAVRQQVRSIDHLILVDSSGTEIVTLTLSTNNNTNNLNWHGELAQGSAYVLHKGMPTQLGLEAVLKNAGAGGVPNELFDTQSFSMIAQGVTTGASYNLVPEQTHYPLHQTATSHITAVQNAGSGSATVTAGSSRTIGTFRVSGETMTGGSLILEALNFTLQATGVSASHYRIGGPSVIQQADCSADTSVPQHITCTVIPSAFQTIHNSVTISVFADVSLNPGAAGGELQLTFDGRGQIGQSGAVHWSDQVGHYTWIESTVPLENGTAWTVSQ